MINSYEIRQHFIDFVITQAEERDIPLWYVGYYSETCESVFRRYMKGIRLPSPIKLIMIAELFECSVNELLGFEYVRVEPRDHRFDSGRDTRHVINYFIEQIEERMKGADLNEASFKRLNQYITNPNLRDIYDFLEICDTLNCTPSDLLGY